MPPTEHQVVLMGYLTTRVVAFLFHDVLENGPIPLGGLVQKSGFSLQWWFPANYAGWAGNRALPVFNHDNLKWNTLWRLLNTDWIIDGWRLMCRSGQNPVFGRSFVIASKPLIRNIVGEVWEIHASMMALSLTG